MNLQQVSQREWRSNAEVQIPLYATFYAAFNWLSTSRTKSVTGTA
jgi:hypothetical protein